MPRRTPRKCVPQEVLRPGRTACRVYRRHARLGVAWLNSEPSTQGPGVGLGDPVSPVLPLGGGRPRLLKSDLHPLAELAAARSCTGEALSARHERPIPLIVEELCENE